MSKLKLKRFAQVAAGFATIAVLIAASPAARAGSETSVPIGLTFGAPGTSTVDYYFDVASTTELVDINVIGSYTSLSALSFQLYKGGTPVGTLATGTLFAGLGYVAGETYTAAPGLYELAVKGTVVAGDSAGAAGGTYTISAVPIPGALPLFGGALAGLGALGWRKARRSRSVVA